ncbi:endonuclease/exonuclease/phosphatase family metal-dependent hydrolase [Rhizobium sp. BK529]|uniref:endonuclease/exonuclease/phosphatase family protein n=1 Tax=unclassified Rhizobium TaxID=2613769 RepID=UPI00104C6E6C|nr:MULTISPECIES: endonuclease/exonuclease/phosphatase family protein [unclassified Rhizobium]MBB3594651.1 endonuclease/exonuclease/phosphatase family metal-dependent hydrolase [Rhizobium sp. BK529]TCS02391.1 endonuclease/exonuclease/phosphatase family metal-dependent hydrolase [Rhizobium sp. BK418]
MIFASYNIQYGFGLDGRYDLERIAKSLDGVDVIALQEVTRGFIRNDYADMPGIIAALFPDHFWVYGPACDMHVEAPEGQIPLPRGTRFQFGNMVLSRWPILSTRTLLLPRSRTVDKINLQRGATEAVIALPGGAVRVYSVHLDHVSVDERIAQLLYLGDRVNAFIQEGASLSGASEFGLPEPPLPENYIIMGDFNMEPESQEYCTFAGSIDRFHGRTARIGTPIDAFAALGAYTSGSYSWMDPKDCGRRMHLDYCFVSCGLKDRLKSAAVDTSSTGSDHFPLQVEISD